MGQTQGLASAAVFLAPDAAAYITGSELRVDGGYFHNLVRYHHNIAHIFSAVTGPTSKGEWMIKQALIKILEENQAIAAQLDESSIADVAEMILAAPRIFVLGQGRSGLVLRMLAVRLVHLSLPVHIVGDTTTPAIRAHDLLITCSGSGTSAVTCLLAEKAVDTGAKLVAITAVPDSRLARMATRVIFVPAPNRHSRPEEGPSIQYEGSLFEQSTLLLCEALFLELRQARNVGAGELSARHANLE